MRGSWRFPPDGAIERAPMPAIAREKRVGLLWSAASCRIYRRRGPLPARPGVEHRLHDPPTGLDIVSALEQSRIAVHAVIDQSLITRARRSIEIILVVELHFDAAHMHFRPRDLGAEPQRHAFLRLNMQDQIILGEP